MANALLQITIPQSDDDWGSDRFSILRENIEIGCRQQDPIATCIGQAYPTDGAAIEALHQNLSSGHYSQVWLIGADVGDAPGASFYQALEAARSQGTSIVYARDHADLGASVRNCSASLQSLGQTNQFHSLDSNPDPQRPEYVNPECPGIQWPCVVTGQNGGVQLVSKMMEHPILAFKSLIPGALVIPAHPHEGVLIPNNPNQNLLLQGNYVQSGASQISAVIEDQPGAGAVLAHSTFHHFADFNLDVSKGCPSFVTDPPSSQIAYNPWMLDDIRNYIRSAAAYFQGRFNG